MTRERNIINGSTALKYSTAAAAERERRYLPQREEKRVSRPIHKKYAKLKYAPSINLISFIALMVIVTAFVMSCVGYVRLYSALKTSEKTTAAVISETKKLAAANANTENSIYSNLNLEEIRKAAIEKLGMVYPYENQIITYKAVTGGYVRQYGELKGNEAEKFFERLLSLVAAR